MKFSNREPLEIPEVSPEVKRDYVKLSALALGGLFAFAHIGILGHVLHRPEQRQVPQVPTINIPRGDYSSYTIKAGKDGYEIQYRANDPKVLESEKSLNLDREKKGLFGGGTEKRTEYRRDQYTMDGVRNIGGTADTTEGKLNAQSVECIVADAGARSQGAMAGTAISAGVVVPAVASIPYVGWLASGWALLLGQKAGSEIGSQVGSAFNDC
ncbi:hypothetical protein [Synechococcus phage S-H38]|uniref:Uncharacterized protein n=1 Tax=Synechococcus phage S-H38 TaxID=2783673 RepID=A0A873WSG7_9CAUD|nr:hypothetical protein PQC14_gp047 [Synechococcus phage S-H38]QPB08014.1 hypothetical protein [Synechococcus phage S-H38]